MLATRTGFEVPTGALAGVKPQLDGRLTDEYEESLDIIGPHHDSIARKNRVAGGEQ